MTLQGIVDARLDSPQRRNIFARVKSIYSMRRAQEILAGVVAILYCDGEGRIDREKEWSSDTIAEIAGWLGGYALTPRAGDRAEFCYDNRHETPCPLPCETCREEGCK